MKIAFCLLVIVFCLWGMWFAWNMGKMMNECNKLWKERFKEVTNRMFEETDK